MRAVVQETKLTKAIFRVVPCSAMHASASGPCMLAGRFDRYACMFGASEPGRFFVNLEDDASSQAWYRRAHGRKQAS